MAISSNGWRAAVAGTFLALLFLNSSCKPGPPLHGLEFIVDIQSERAGDTNFQHTVTALRRRLVRVGPSTPFFETTVSNRVRIVLRPLSELDRGSMQNQITNSGVIEFRLVHSNSREFLKLGVQPPGWEVLEQQQTMPDFTIRTEAIVVRKETEGGLTSRAIKSATVSRDNIGRPEILFQFSPEGTRVLAGITRSNVGRTLAIVFNGRVLAAPTIRAAIEGGAAELTGDYTDREAQNLASLLENPLDAPVTIVSERKF